MKNNHVEILTTGQSSRQSLQLLTKVGIMLVSVIVSSSKLKGQNYGRL